MSRVDFRDRTGADRGTPVCRGRSRARRGVFPVEFAVQGQVSWPALPVCRGALRDPGSFPGSGWDRVGVIWPRDEVIG